MIEQRTKEWKQQRLGYFTGSCIGKLMSGTRSDKSAFGDAAMSYIYSVSAERNLNDKVVEDETIWQMYDEQVSAWSKAIQFGIDWEPEARKMYAKVTDNRVTETGSIEHPTIAFLSASPDGIIETKDGEKGVLEIKCPTPSVFMEYCDKIFDNTSLKKANPEYFYQTQAEMFVTETSFCDFVAFNPFMRNKIHIVRITPDGSVFEAIKERVEKANMIINEILRRRCITK